MVFAGSPAGRDHRSVIIGLAAVVLLVSVLFAPCPAVARDASAFADLAAEYKKTIRPLLGRYCLGCHSTKKKVGELDLGDGFQAIQGHPDGGSDDSTFG